MKRYFIIDTHVVVAGLLTSHADSPVARILDGMLGARFAFVLSEALLAEYRAVLVRPHPQDLRKIDPARRSDADSTDVRQGGTTTLGRFCVSPNLVKMHGLSADELDTILLELARHAIVLTPAHSGVTPKAPDPGNQFLWDLLSSRADLFLVTGDKLLLQDHTMKNRVLTPLMFVDLP